MVGVLLALSAKPHVNVTFLRYEETGQFGIFRFSNNTQSDLSCHWNSDWRLPDMSTTYANLERFEVRDVRLANLTPLNLHPANLEIIYYARPTRLQLIRMRLRGLIFQQNGLSTGVAAPGFSVVLPAIPVGTNGNRQR